MAKHVDHLTLRCRSEAEDFSEVSSLYSADDMIAREPYQSMAGSVV